VLEFSVSQKVSIFIAFPENKANPLNDEFEYTDQKISVLKVNPTDSSEKPHAELSIGYKIYQLAHHNAGKVKIPIEQGQTPLNILVWIRQSSSKAEALSCGGEETVLSTKAEDYKSCDVHKESSQMACASAFPPELTGETSWIYSPGKGKQKWVELKLKSKYQMIRFDYKPILNQVNNIRKLKVTFDDQFEEIFDLLKLDIVQTFEFELRQTSRLNFEIYETFQNELESGGSFQVHGLKCEALNAELPLGEKEKVTASCGDTIFNHPILSTQPLKPGASFTIKCASGCE